MKTSAATATFGLFLFILSLSLSLFLSPALDSASADESSGRGGPAPDGNLGCIHGVVRDSTGAPVPHASITVLGTHRGVVADGRGAFRIDGLEPGTYLLNVSAAGCLARTSEPVEVKPGGATEVRLLAGTLGTKQSREEVRESEGSSVGGVLRKLLPFAAQAPDLIPRDSAPPVMSRGSMDAAGAYREAPLRETGRPVLPVIPYTGGTHLPNDEPFDAMFFRHYGVNPFVAVEDDALSTFALDVDTGSYSVMRRYVNLGYLPPSDAVRVEEFVNYFDQGYPSFDDVDFRIFLEGAPSPFGSGYHLIRVGLKAREIPERLRKPADLVFVIDVSGSMAREDRLGLVQDALRILVDQLRSDDRVGIVIYGSRGEVLLEPTSVAHRGRILRAIDSLTAGGSTNAEEGLLLGYEMARRLLEGGRIEAARHRKGEGWIELARHGHGTGRINRIILCSDGVANVGRTGPDSILERVRRETDQGIYLTTVGFGMGNYNDVLMEQLADDGDGRYHYVDNREEARRIFQEQLTGNLQVVARDAKIQVEFDPRRVERYRLLGFENRDVADRDFRNDSVDAGEIGAGHEVTALYEIKLADSVRRGRLATVRLRYAEPEAGYPVPLDDPWEDRDPGRPYSEDPWEEGRPGKPRVHEISAELDASSLCRRLGEASPRFRLDAAVAEFAEILRESYWARESRVADVLPLARDAARDLRWNEEAEEFIRILEQAQALRSGAGGG